MRRLIYLSALLAALLFAACGGGDGEPTDGDPNTSTWPSVLELIDGDITPAPLNSRIIVGDSRFLLGLLDAENQLVLGASVNLRFYKIDGETGTLVDETAATYISLIENFVHDHEDGAGHVHEGDELGAYSARIAFNTAGPWGVEIDGSIEGEAFDTLRLRFSVLETGIPGNIPAIGDAAFPSEQLTLSDVADISEIDSASPPHPAMHDITIAEALATGKPLVIAFTTPAFCTSRICGPVLSEVVVPLFDKYQAEAIFIHVEPYDLGKARAGEGLETVQAFLDWNLPTEPWMFLIDSDGRIAAKFEGLTNVEEIEPELEKLLG